MKTKNCLDNIKSYFFFLLLWVAGSCSEKEIVEINNAPIPRIIEVLPANASIGDEVSIVGVNFADSPEGNEVKFNQQIVPIISINDGVIKVKVPEVTGNTVGISVRSNGKISNKRNLALVKIEVFEDDFNRDNTDLVESTVIPNPIGSKWQIVTGVFGIKVNKLYSNAPSIESYVLYRDPELNMDVGEGSYFKLIADVNVSGGSFGGIVFNAQADNKRFYLLRINGDLVQLLKTGNNGLGDWNVMLSDNFPGFVAGVTYKVEITSSTPGKLLVKIVNPESKEILLDRSFDDPTPYTGGTPGFYYFGLANPVNISFDNFSVETM